MSNYRGTLLNNQCLIPFASTPNTIPNPEYRTPMISNNLTLNKYINSVFNYFCLVSYIHSLSIKSLTNLGFSNVFSSGNYSPFTQRSYEPDSFAYAFQKSSSLNPTRRPRGRWHHCLTLYIFCLTFPYDLLKRLYSIVKFIRPRRFQSVMPSSLSITTPNNMSLVPATQTLLTPPR